MAISIKTIHVVLIVLFVLCVVLMALDIILQRTEAVLFYLVVMAVLIIRLAGVNICTNIVHALTYAYLIGFLLFLRIKTSYAISKTSIDWLLVSLILMFLISLHLMLFRPGKTYNERAYRASVHAVMGMLVVILTFWICCFTVVTGYIHTILQAFFFLIFLFIMLTPYFQSESHAVNIAQYGPPPEKVCKM